jgi:hypothetical protein
MIQIGRFLIWKSTLFFFLSLQIKLKRFICCGPSSPRKSPSIFAPPISPSDAAELAASEHLCAGHPCAASPSKSSALSRGLDELVSNGTFTFIMGRMSLKVEIIF